jgi:hypothetical protein
MERSSATKDEINFMFLGKQLVQASLVSKTNAYEWKTPSGLFMSV